MFVATSNETEPSSFTNTSASSSSSSSVQRSQLCRQFEFHEILSATKNFDESSVIGRGGFGKVYKGDINIGSTFVVAAIKRLDAMSNQGPSEFWAEVEMLSKLRHCHLVSLIGYCNYETEMILVYEYMPNGTLEDHLHKNGTPLSWCQRLKMCIGAARGLDYLHTGTGIKTGIIHRDVKSSNILLDECWGAKVSDFGLSKISPRNQPSTHVSTLVKGTFGYFDPNYFATGKLTTKSDVYAFGVVLLEVLCRKRAVDDSLEWGLATWAQDSIKEGRLRNIVDPDIRSEISTKCLKGFARIAEKCLEEHPKNRATMAEVVLRLECVLNFQEKSNNLLQTTGKSIFGRVSDMFSFTDNSGMEMSTNLNIGSDLGSLMPKKPYIGLDFGSLNPYKNKKKQLMAARKQFFLKNGSLLLEDKLRNSLGLVKFFGADDIEKATMNYAENMVLGRGGSGNVYKGILPDERVVAIKRARIMDQEHITEQFINEIAILGQINHRNLVQVLGCCLETEVPLLIYEFVSNGNLYEIIHGNISTGRLSWDNRLRIAHETAGALAYLHSDTTVTIIHRDVKSSNILLDENYTAKVADFGGSKLLPFGEDHLSTQVYGTLGYLAPEYMICGQLTEKSDVYSFGVVLAELLTGLKPIDHKRYDQDHPNLATLFMRAERENWLPRIVDLQVLEEATDEQIEATCQLTCRCLREKGDGRPSMKEVAMELERIKKLNIQPWGPQDNYVESSETFTTYLNEEDCYSVFSDASDDSETLFGR
ncbi:hypothetical protein SSX86_007050 [Deinandra increscens subsp. villosa]|uniref:Protein kinase domain-containing protein n=1 Tax=Deinandra increscens subsp. villosa TaxID=3103831 RepID=A0AAP0DKM3_9ASTR